MDILNYITGIVLIFLVYLLCTRRGKSQHEEIYYFHNFLNTVPVPAIIIERTRKNIQILNERAAHLLEVPVCSTTIPNAIDFFGNPKELEEIFQTLLSNEKIIDYELRMITRNGREFWALISAN